jgi:hypothetical protein
MSNSTLLGVKLIFRLLWALASVGMIVYGWCVRDLRFLVIGCAFAVDNNLSAGIYRLERKLSERWPR